MSKVTDWIQACSALMGVVGLAVYAFDTREIRKATLAQSDAARRPFFVGRIDYSQGKPRFRIQNVGTGPALSLTWRYADEETPRFLDSSDFAVGHEKLVSGLVGDEAILNLLQHGGLCLNYTDLAEKKYWSKIRLKGTRNTIQTLVTTGADPARQPSFLERIDR